MELTMDNGQLTIDNYGSVSLRSAGLTNGWGTDKMALPLGRRSKAKREIGIYRLRRIDS